MPEPILLIDTNYLCHRAYHAIGEMAYGDMGTGAVFGVLRDIVILQDFFNTTRCVFAFDKGRGYRYDLLPTYKSTRKARHADESEEDKIAREDFKQQIERLRRNYLPAAGFKNIFAINGLEADDIIASIAGGLPRDEEAVIIGSDQDLWQCLRDNVYCWSPHTQRAYSLETFRKQWGIKPHQWADVKAYAGCSSDDVPGLPGVGEKTAAKYIRGELGDHTKAYAKLAAGTVLHDTNMKLVRLPFPGTPKFEFVPDEVTEEKWQALADGLGMRSIRSTAPRVAGRKSKGRKRGRQKEKGFGLDSTSGPDRTA